LTSFLQMRKKAAGDSTILVRDNILQLCY